MKAPLDLDRGALMERIKNQLDHLKTTRREPDLWE